MSKIACPQAGGAEDLAPPINSLGLKVPPRKDCSSNKTLVAQVMTTARPISSYFNPYRIVRKLYRVAYCRFVWNGAAIAVSENAKLLDAGLDVGGALSLLDPLLVRRRGRGFDWAEDSVHWLVFAAYARFGKSIKRILEIGTFDGEFTWLLSQLFPEARIVTVDLPDSDPLLRGLYDREDNQKYVRYQTLQKKNIDQPNIQALKVNSLFLLDHTTGSFDLIWVDGGHLYPEVAWDICQAWHLCAPAGAVLYDDVIDSHRHYRDDYVSTESFETLEYLASRVGSPLELFLKRRNPEHHAFRHLRKYVARVKKPA